MSASLVEFIKGNGSVTTVPAGPYFLVVPQWYWDLLPDPKPSLYIKQERIPIEPENDGPAKARRRCC